MLLWRIGGVLWLADNCRRLGICRNKLFLSGESGGANLAIATAFRLNQLRNPNHPNNAKHSNTTISSTNVVKLRGVYILCPYIAGKYPDERFPSTFENNGIFITVDGSGDPRHRTQSPNHPFILLNLMPSHGTCLFLVTEVRKVLTFLK